MLLPPDSDDGFNIRKNRERAALLAKMRKEAAASAASDAEVPPESNYPTSGRSEGDEEEPQEEEQGEAEGVDDEEYEGEDEDGEDVTLRQDSDFERRTFSRMIRHGIDPNDGEAQDVLRHGPPRHEKVEVESEEESSTAAQESAELPGADGPVHEYNFNEWVRYVGDPMEEGAQTDVDKLTRYRIRGDRDWLPIPDGLRCPRYASNQEQQVDQHVLACSKLGRRASNFPEPQLSKPPSKTMRSSAPLPSQPLKSNQRAALPAKAGARVTDQGTGSAGNAKVNPRGLRQMLIELGMAKEPSADMEVDESDPSGSDYSETRKDAQRRKGEEEEEEEEEDESEDEGRSGAGDKGPTRSRRKERDEPEDSSEEGGGSGGEQVEVDEGGSSEESQNESEDAQAPPRKLKDKGRAEESTARGVEAGKAKQVGRKGGAKGAPGRPGREQLQAIKDLRILIEGELEKLSNEFQASRESLLGQLGMGGKEHRKMSLFNLFSQIKSLDEPQEGVHGCSFSFLAFFGGVC